MQKESKWINISRIIVDNGTLSLSFLQMTTLIQGCCNHTCFKLKWKCFSPTEYFVEMCVTGARGRGAGHGINTPGPSLKLGPEYHLISNCRFMYFWNFQTFIWASLVQAGWLRQLTRHFKKGDFIKNRWKVKMIYWKETLQIWSGMDKSLRDGAFRVF